MSMKKMAMLQAMTYALAGIGGMNIGVDNEKPIITYTPKTKEQIEAEKIAQYKRNGLKEWTINGCVVWAATKKAAIKKANKTI